MFSAHLVFADLDSHSFLPLPKRNEKLRLFWQICEAARPTAIEKSPFSFYTLDNDGLHAGFSNVAGLQGGADVLVWAADLHEKLEAEGAPATFAAVTLACSSDFDWSVREGIDDDSMRMHVATEHLRVDGNLDRTRITGDPLTIAARLLDIAKRSHTRFVFAVRGASLYQDKQACYPELDRAGLRHRQIPNALSNLDREKASWLRDREVVAYELVPGGPRMRA